MTPHSRNAFARLRYGAAPLALALGLIASPALAQSDPQDPPATQSDATNEDNGEELVVTGSLFSRTDTETPSPVTVLTEDNLAKAGITTAADAIRSISADSAGSIGTGFQTGFSAGGSAVSLRGLGVSSTLVLVNGLRGANFPINDDGHNAYVDLNSIPFSLVDRIEVLKDGASSTYGADAIGGVVNLILKKQFNGLEGRFEAGEASKGDADFARGSLTAGFGDYDRSGWNVYLNAEYQFDGRVSNHSRGFPYNTQDLTPIGGTDNNSADQSLTVNTPTAYVTRVHQNDLNNPLSGAAGSPLTNQYDALGLSNCTRGTYTVTTGSARGTGCKYDLTDMYRQIQPQQVRYAFNGKLSFRLSDNVEGYVTAGYSRDRVSITSAFPSAIRQTQPFGAAPSVASSNPGIVLPVYVCSSGVNCATASDRRLNPNNPYAGAYAADPSNGAARIYYLFSDITPGSDRTNEVFRATAGLNGEFSGWNWRVEAVASRDQLHITQHGLLNIAALLKAINTGSYNFVNPLSNSLAVREAIAPDKTTPSHSQLYALDASVTKALLELPGGELQLAVGGQIRREVLENNNQNKALDTYGLTTASAFGQHTVAAAFFEVDAPLLDQVELNLSGRYDHYSEGFGHFSPKVGLKVTPISPLALRGTYSKGFRAPTFAESGPLSQYAGFVTTTPPCNFILAHGGTGSTSSCSANGNPYNLAYSLGRGVAGNPNLEPETSRSFTAGMIFEPARWLSFTADYYNVKKSNLIVAGPDIGRAVNAYFAAANLAAAQTAVAAIGPGYSVNTVDGVDPLYPSALPRVLIINVPYVNANFALTSGIDLAATTSFDIASNIKFTSRAEVTHVFRYNLHTSSGIQRYAGTFGPYDLSSGNGTPDWRGNWQNTIEIGRFALTATAYYVGKIKEVATDQGNLSTDCAQNLYHTGDKFCYVNEFIDVDLNAQAQINDHVKLFLTVRNLLDARAPVAPAAYGSAPNFLTTWHYAGLIGRAFRGGVAFNF